MERLRLSFLGSFAATLGGKPLTGFRSDKVRALLAYLAVEADRPHRRDALATLLWSDYGERAARTNLRISLANLRSILAPLTPGEDEDPLLTVTRQSVQFHRGDAAVVDVHDFNAHLHACELHPHREMARCLACIRRLTEAVELYQGDFLAGLAPANSPTFDEWRLVVQERLHRQALAALHTLATHCLDRGDYEQAGTFARQQIALAPWQEEAHRQLMLALAAGGERAAALAQYERCRALLAQELAVEPSLETTALYEAIRTGDFEAAAAVGQVRLGASGAGSLPPHNLPAPTTPFIGREAELAEVRKRLLDPAYRLLTLVGPGGVGKTRLALAAAERGSARFPDGVWFVPLTALSPPDERDRLTGGRRNLLAAAIAAPLHFSFQGNDPPARQLLNYLAPRELLLVLDSFEHLLDVTDFVVEILAAAPAVTLLVTSRERLALQAEFVIGLEGLPVPPEPVDESAARCASVELFAERAERTATGFALTGENLPEVARICRTVAGLPLAIELAASWAGRYTCAEIACSVQENIDFLATSMRDIPARHRSVQAVFEHSWRLLTLGERCTLARCSIFRGSFGRDAVLSVTEATLHDLIGLVEKSLLRRITPGRYELHELLRQFAARKRTALAAEQIIDETALGHRHCDFYLDLVAAQEEALTGGKPRRALTELGRNMENVRQAWLWAVQRRKVRAIGRSLGGLARFYALTGRQEDGEAACRFAAEQLEDRLEAAADAGESAEVKAVQRVLGRLLAEQSRFLRGQSRFDEALAILGPALAHAEAAGDRAGQANIHQQEGQALVRQGRYAEAEQCLIRARALAQSGGARKVEADSLRALGIAVSEQGQYAAARALYADALRICREIGDRQGEGQTLNNLGVVAWSQGKAAETKAYLEQALAIFREVGSRKDEAGVLPNLGLVAHHQGDYTGARRYYEQALAMCREMGYRHVQGTILSLLGFISAEQGAYPAAQSYYEEGLQICRTIGDRLGESWRLVYLGLLHHHLGENRLAVQHGQQALAVAEEIGDRSVEAYALTNLGHALVELGQMEAAAGAYGQALVLRRELGEEHLATETLAGLARLALLQEDRRRSLAHVEDILAFLAESRLEGVDDPFRVHLTCYRVLDACGDERAHRVLQRAWRLLQRRASQIDDEAVRRSFLENVRAHRELAETAARQLGLP